MTHYATTDLRPLRISLGLTQEEFAKELGLLRGSYSDLERGKVKEISGSVQQILQSKFSPGEATPKNYDATNLRQLRKSLGLSQAEFAEKIGLKQGSYSAVEAGKKNISQSVALLISIKYGKAKPCEHAPKNVCPEHRPDLEFVPAIGAEHRKQGGLPTLTINLHKGRFYVSKGAAKLIGVTALSKLAFYQDKGNATHWYVAVEDVMGAIPLVNTREGALIGTSKPLASKILALLEQEISASFYVEKGYSKYWRLVLLTKVR